VVLIENVERVSAELERYSLGNVNRFLKANVEIAIAWLTEVLNTWSLA